MRWFKIFILCMTLGITVVSCDTTPQHADTLTVGAIDISADEAFQPIIEAQKKVFDSSWPEAKITIHYKSESECFKDYFDNKARIILVTRDLTKVEKDLCEQKQIFPVALPLAREGIAVIVNKESPETMLDMPALKGILGGIYKKKLTVVFDNQSSGILRYITDSVLKGDTLGKNVFAAKGSQEVVDYVMKNPDAIGFVGLSYVSDSYDPGNTGTFINDVKVVHLLNDKTKEYLQPYQAYIALRSYPLTRTLYYINRESYPGLGTGFANFLAAQRGQLIFFHSHLFPVRSEMVIRDVEINNK